MTSNKVFEVIKVCADLDRSELEKVIQMLVQMVGAKAYEYGYQQHETELLDATASAMKRQTEQLIELADKLGVGKKEVE